MNNSTRVLSAAVATAALVLGPVVAANAVAWDGNDIGHGGMTWLVDTDSVALDNIALGAPGSSVFADPLDQFGVALIEFDPVDGFGWLGVEDAGDVDVAEVDDDLVLTATAAYPNLTENNLTADIELRIYADGDLARQSVTYTNTGTESVTANIGFDTEFGSTGEVIGYQNSSDAVLSLPASEDDASRDALNDSGAKWAVHQHDCDAPASIAWGDATAEEQAYLSNMNGADWDVRLDDVVIPAGEAVTTVVFLKWAPSILIDNDYDNNACDSAKQDLYSAALVAASTEFDSFSGRMTAGLEGVNVINWTPADAEPEALAATGVNTVSSGLAVAGVLSLVGAVSLAAVRRRTV